MGDNNIIEVYELCTICLYSIKTKNKSKSLDCNHIFHLKCINKLYKHNYRSQLKCPICRDLIQESSDNNQDIINKIYDIYDKQ